MAALQRFFAKFPTQINRENISGNWEFLLSIREFLVCVTSPPKEQASDLRTPTQAVDPQRTLCQEVAEDMG
jgi:hypothetical protein